jgi:hypothetical protein
MLNIRSALIVLIVLGLQIGCNVPLHNTTTAVIDPSPSLAPVRWWLCRGASQSRFNSSGHPPHVGHQSRGREQHVGWGNTLAGEVLAQVDVSYCHAQRSRKEAAAVRRSSCDFGKQHRAERKLSKCFKIFWWEKSRASLLHSNTWHVILFHLSTK